MGHTGRNPPHWVPAFCWLLGQFLKAVVGPGATLGPWATRQGSGSSQNFSHNEVNEWLSS